MPFSLEMECRERVLIRLDFPAIIYKKGAQV